MTSRWPYPDRHYSYSAIVPAFFSPYLSDFAVTPIYATGVPKHRVITPHESEPSTEYPDKEASLFEEILVAENNEDPTELS